MRRLDEVSDVINGGTPKTGVKEYWDGDNLWITPAEMGKRETPYIAESQRTLSEQGLQNSSATLVPPYSVIMSTRAPIGHLVINTKPMAFNQGCRGIVPRDGLEHKYLYYFLLCSVELLNELGTGATFKELSAGKLKSVVIPVPSVEEQQRIVAILDKAFAGIAIATANAEKNLQNARELFESTLQSVFAEKGEGWVTRKLEDIVDETCSLSYGIVQPGVDVNGGLPVVRPTDLTNKVIHLDGLKRIEPELATSYSRTTLQGSDLLLCVRGSTGTVSIAAKELTGANVTRGIVPIRFEPTVMSNEFGYYQLISKFVQDQIKAGTYGAALMQINIRDLRKVEVKVPPIDVQKELTKKLDRLTEDVDRLESTYINKLDALVELKQTILQKAFAGELH